MPKPIVLALLALAPGVAFADEPPPPAVTVTVNPVITVNAPPAAAVPAAPAPPAEAAAAPVEGDPCVHGSYHGPWKSRMKGRLSLGFAKSHVELADDREGTQKSLVGRVAFRRGFAVELELARGEIGDDRSKTFGGAILKSFGMHKLQPYVIAGGGGGRLELADGTESRMRYAEFGAGLMLQGRRFGIGVDFRRGVRHVEEADEARMMDARETTPPDDDSHDRERYTRGRILGLVRF